MEILVNLDVMMAKRKISAGELAERVASRPRICPFSKTTRPRPSVSPRWRPSVPPWTASRETFWEFVPDEEAEP